MTTCLERPGAKQLYHGTKAPSKACPACGIVCCGGCMGYPFAGMCVACGRDAVGGPKCEFQPLGGDRCKRDARPGSVRCWQHPGVEDA